MGATKSGAVLAFCALIVWASCGNFPWRAHNPCGARRAVASARHAVNPLRARALAAPTRDQRESPHTAIRGARAKAHRDRQCRERAGCAFRDKEAPVAPLAVLLHGQALAHTPMHACARAIRPQWQGIDIDIGNNPSNSSLTNMCATKAWTKRRATGTA